MPHTHPIFRAFLCTLLAGGFATTTSAHPGGSAVSIGSNPVRSFSGDINVASQDLIVTDVVSGLVADRHYCMGAGRLIMKNGGGTHLAEFPLYFSHLEDAGAPSTTVLQATSGILVPAGTVITLEWAWSYRECGDSSYRVPYLFTGYLAQP